MTRRVNVIVHGFFDWPKEFMDEIVDPWAYRKAPDAPDGPDVPKKDRPGVHVRWPAHWRVFGGDGRVGHEMLHELDATFDDLDPDEEGWTEATGHHDLTHGCLRSRAPFRKFDHNSYQEGPLVKAVTREDARRAKRDGYFEVPT